jgi:hypothetical protein
MPSPREKVAGPDNNRETKSLKRDPGSDPAGLTDVQSLRCDCGDPHWIAAEPGGEPARAPDDGAITYAAPIHVWCACCAPFVQAAIAAGRISALRCESVS